jgi:hypothetical protein
MLNGLDMRSGIICATFPAKKNGQKVTGNNFKITLKVITWPVFDHSTVPVEKS